MNLQDAKALVEHAEKIQKMRDEFSDYLQMLKTRGRFCDDFEEMNEIARQFNRIVQKHTYGRVFE